MFWRAVYLCRNGFVIEVQMLDGKHHLTRGPQSQFLDHLFRSHLGVY